MKNKIINKLRKIIKRERYGLHYFLKDIISRDKVVVNYWIPPQSDPEFYNFGDDLNRDLVGLISGKTVIPYTFSSISRLKKSVNYLCIGSVISQLTNERTVIWGSGVLSPELPLKHKPLKVLAVRGPLSRDYLVKNGVDCPEIYGDPALLLSKYYQPVSYKKKYKIGIIPHYTDKNNPLLDIYKKYSGVYVFDVQNYGNYKLFIDTLCSCECVISSSLHGLIISDSYGIPNTWVEFSSGILGGHFKFIDYLLSVQRSFDNFPVELTTFIPLDELQSLAGDWQPPKVDARELMSVCPFK
ncbi:polysaccharide pyruvyl transferase family protein [Petrimonas mucosa]|jgi:pyruvyltransferase|nr:polysaccharide pyruvyl transferase family protein [Petrimonas mucosa]